jgi:hypothetical protein
MVGILALVQGLSFDALTSYIERKPRFAASATALDLTVAASWPAVGPSTRLLKP